MNKTICEKCFGYDGSGCRILHDSDFKGKPCPFFKTPAQNKKDMDEAKARLDTKVFPRRFK